MLGYFGLSWILLGSVMSGRLGWAGLGKVRLDWVGLAYAMLGMVGKGYVS